MPPFWKSLLGGGSSSHASSSSSSSAAHGISSSNGSNGKLDAGLSSSLPSSSSNAASRKTSSSSLASPSSASSSSARHHHHKPHHHGSAAAADSPARASASNAGARQHNSTAGRSSPMVIPGQSAAAGHIPPAPAGIPLSGSAGSRQQHATSLASTSGLSGASSYAETTADDTDDASIPDTPYSTGHSPSHARHKFPQEKSKRNGAGSINGSPLDSSGSGRDANDESDTFFSDDDAPYNAGGVSNGADSRSNLEPSSSGFSKSMDPSSPSLSTSSGTGPNAQQSPFKPDIPTTHTILANPLPQPSSGLAAALSSVLPTSSSSSNTSAATSAPTNGKGAAPASGSGGNDAPQGPRTFDIDDMITRLLETGYSGKQAKSVSLKNSEITALCLAAREVFLSQPTLLELSPPVNIVGDVHGQYSDLIRLFEMCSFPPHANYLFLGDYVDRGKQSLETILLLLCYKVKYPENFFLLRGNHECANVTRVYGFYDECKRRCNLKIWKTFVDVFNCLPIAALVAGKIFCVHGGLSPSLSSMDDIRRISRPTDVPDYGLLNDLLWSDPSDTALDWEDNERGVSYCFGKAVIQEFLTKYDFDLICRAHMVVEDGYEFWNDRTLVTIFSAPNYCGEFDNFASSMLVNEDLLCSFELLKPLDGAALKKELAKCRKKNSAGLLPARPAPEK